MYLEGNVAAPQNNATAFKYFSMAASKVGPQPIAVNTESQLTRSLEPKRVDFAAAMPDPDNEAGQSFVYWKSAVLLSINWWLCWWRHNLSSGNEKWE